MRLPNGVSTHTRQSPSSSRQRSTTMVRSSGTWPVASAWSARNRSRFSAAPGSRSCSLTSRVSAAGCGNARSSRTIAPMRRPNSSGRPGPSPFQNGILPGSPGAGVTSTRSCVMSAMRHVEAPRMNVSFGCDSKTISSSSSPTRTGLPSLNARKTPYSPRSGMVPAFRIASRAAPSRAVTTLRMRSQVSRGRSSRKLVGWVAAAEQIEHAIEGRARQPRERRRAAAPGRTANRQRPPDSRAPSD